ncbi:MAG: HlyD family efflux transporter periplasmic adaptor subunit [Eubacteriales bacterium]|nr:HlyD family efflux transporter periplasmic adaptor subunit [Eubacteriales bacterium]
MGKKKKKRNNIVKLPRRFRLNVGMPIIIFILIAVYIVFTIAAYARRDQVKFYEVEEGSIVKENTYTGLILREETVVNAQAAGYLNYYIPDGRKTAKGTSVYSIDETGRLQQYLSQHPEELNTLSDGNVAELRAMLSNFNNAYSDLNFRALYDTNASLRAQVMEYSNFNTMAAISSKLADSGIVFNSYASDRSGIVSYTIDGMEAATAAELTASMFDRSQYARTITKSGAQIAADTPVYKLITSDNWQIAFQLSEDDSREFADQKQLRIRFPDNDISTTAAYEQVQGADGADYGILSLSRYLVQFTSQRYVDFEIVTNDVSGLKLPEKSVTTKDFYIIPVSYLQTDEQTGAQGFLREVVSENGTAAEYVSPELYNIDQDYCYIDTTEDTALKAGDYVKSPEGDDHYQIGPTKSLEGVYNINKGYAVFKRIETLERANGYCIVKKGTSYGLSVYDHIVLDAATVNDGQLIYR